MTCKMNLGTEVFFLTHNEDTYMLRPYGRFDSRGVNYAVYKQTATGFEKACCVSCQTDDYAEKVWDAVKNELHWGVQDWLWEEAESVWEKDNF